MATMNVSLPDPLKRFVEAQVTAAGAALGFVDVLQEAKRLLAEHPSIGSPRYAIETGIPELRGLTLQRYPYVVFHTDDPDAVRIPRVLHTGRDIPAELSET